MLLGCEGLILFKDIEENHVYDVVKKGLCSPDGEPSETYRSSLLDALYLLTSICKERGFSGNLWELFITDLIINSENIYSLSCEAGGTPDQMLNGLILHDLEIILKLMKADIAGLIQTNDLGFMDYIADYNNSSEGHIYDDEMKNRISTLKSSLRNADSEKEALEILTDFYREYGVGKLGLHKAFCAEEAAGGGLNVEPVYKMMNISLEDIYGYDTAKNKLIENTEAFIMKRPANNCLLYGDAGTGKSSCIRALASRYFNRGLRIIQIHREDLKLLQSLTILLKNRNYRFIIYMDDLSFEDFETEYKYLKAVIEGGLEMRPENILIYATSNRRHLIKETVSDRDDRDEDMHRSDTMAEKLSLSQRFGISIYFGAPDKNEYLAIVKGLSLKAGISMPEDKLFGEAEKWALYHGGRSGRCAVQFVDYLSGKPSADEEVYE